MKSLLLICCLLFIGLGVFSQTNSLTKDSLKNKDNVVKSVPKLNTDTLTESDFITSIERVSDRLNAIQDSVKLRFEVVLMSRKIAKMTSDIAQIRQNVRGKNSVVNLKYLYLYQSFASELEEENDKMQSHINRLYNRLNRAKQNLKTVFSDSVYIKFVQDSKLQNTFNKKLSRLKIKKTRTDSIAKVNIDSLNGIRVKLADNSLTLSNIQNMINNKLDKSETQLFGDEVNKLWEKDRTNPIDTTTKAINILSNEQKAISYYVSRTSGERTTVFVLGILLFIWLFFKRKIMKSMEEKSSIDFLHLQFLNKHSILSILIILLCLMPFFDAYAPTSYIAIEYLLLLSVVSVILFKKEACFQSDWIILIVLFVVNTLTYLSLEPTFIARLWILSLHSGIVVFSYRFYKKLNKEMQYYKWVRIAVAIGIILTSIAIVLNLLGRFSLAGLFGIAGVFALTHAIVLTVFIRIIIEIVLIQLESIRFKKGISKPFDSSIVIDKIKMPLFIVAVLLWLIMLASNLDIYHNVSNSLEDFLKAKRTIGSISFELISVLMFFIIIWSAHILQQWISFLFGEVGEETEEINSTSKGQHSRLLITRLLVLIGGYLLAIAASGLPIDKLTFVLGAFGVGVGMGLQNIVNNFVSGIILIFDGSLQIGDQIEVNGQVGKVKGIGLRASTLNTSEGAEVIIPNGSILSQNIVNWTFSNDEKRVSIEFILTGSSLDANVINEIINNTIQAIPNVISQKKPVIFYTKVTKESYSLKVQFWSIINKAEHVKSDAILQLSSAFTKIDVGFE